MTPEQWGLLHGSQQGAYNTASQVGQTAGQMGDLSQSLLNFQSPLYQQYASYLQKTTPGIGLNSMLGTLMAGGTGYAGGQAIAQQRLQSMAGQRQDKINTGVQGFGLGNIGTGASLLG